MSSVTNKQLLELVSESRLLSSVAIEGEVKLLDPMALDRCWKWRYSSNKTRTFIPHRVDLKARKEDLGTKGWGERPELHNASSKYLVPYRQVPFPLLAS